MPCFAVLFNLLSLRLRFVYLFPIGG
jgi:hypothetical protein